MAIKHEPFPWYRYSKKVQRKIDTPRSFGTFDSRESEARAVRLAVGSEGTPDEGNAIRFYWLVDRDDGTIIDAKYQLYGQSALIAAAEAACELTVGKNYDQARRISADLIDKQLRDRSERPAFPMETYPHLNLVVDAIETIATTCSDIPLPTSYASPPTPLEEGEEREYPGWEKLTTQQQVAVIEEVLDHEVRPYIALDAGGVEVLNLVAGKEVLIAYQGTCTSCYSAVGTTLSYIQQTLRRRIHPDLVVTPDIDFDVS